MDFPKRGAVYLVSLDPTIGAEIKKTRPAVIIQNDVGNEFSQVTIIAPITSGEDAIYPVEVEVKAGEGGLKNDSLVELSQIRAVDKKRLVRYLGRLRPETMERVDRAIEISLGLTSS